MERMAGGQDSWARWKSAVLALPEALSRSYLRDAEGYSAERIERLLRGTEATIVPGDWAVTAESKDALARYEAWEMRSAADGNRDAIMEFESARAAALPAAEAARNTTDIEPSGENV